MSALIYENFDIMNYQAICNYRASKEIENLRTPYATLQARLIANIQELNAERASTSPNEHRIYKLKDCIKNLRATLQRYPVKSHKQY